MNKSNEEMKPDLKLINEDPVLMSLLYDLDLLPEQLENPSYAWGCMLSIVSHWSHRRSDSQERVREERLERALRTWRDLWHKDMITYQDKDLCAGDYLIIKELLKESTDLLSPSLKTDQDKGGEDE